ncbi:hypothetical protein MOK15_01685 [Sphingobium sp. BYY-5]|uniref:hypothetical protein n=1 Tax=Sphingobium sp. BYY-5 TaxID=2926400 RepID=UPI001FA7D14D|nr:hypothetical protein [Sphingobium sp. BYY-5]MCI4588821.1 hypothetical protein [Sphingobium sp. BYY-5]
MMLALVAGCRASDDSVQADNAMSAPPLALVDNAAPLPPPAPPATPPRPGPIVTVRAQPAPYFPLDLPPSDVAASAAPFPREVTEFMVTRDSCDHFRGEEPYDAERRAYIEENVAELCQGSDAKLAMLRRRYASDPTVISALKGYQDRIETPPVS